MGILAKVAEGEILGHGIGVAIDQNGLSPGGRRREEQQSKRRQ
ncbi:MAG: hypothetical protein BWZ08_02694 [candidate division BRC1 bacterium ADurb.BinA292]|nr:MAG: hypothetical protein BWZ08_02694 [candidate division BRC1 bacterium ADurb.BinA292]